MKINVQKLAILFALLLPNTRLFSQNIQIHYDFRHTFYPELISSNYPSLSFEYFKTIDSLGSFLLKLQSDFNGNGNNMNQTFVQVSQNIKLWRPEFYLSLGYSGGLGVTTGNFGYYLNSAYSIGLSYPTEWRGAWLSFNLGYRYNSFDRPSHDAAFTFYFGRGLMDYKLFVSGNWVAWTENKFKEAGSVQNGKRMAFFADPQIWMKIRGKLSVGSRMNVYYNLLASDKLHVYPTLGLKCDF